MVRHRSRKQRLPTDSDAPSIRSSTIRWVRVLGQNSMGTASRRSVPEGRQPPMDEVVTEDDARLDTRALQ